MTDDHAKTRLIAACLEDFERRGDPAVEDHCAAHPELATRIRDAVEAMREFGFGAGNPTAAGGESDFAGRYRLLDRLGAGGMGTVYRAQDRQLDRVVALKKIRGDFADFEVVRQRFDRELLTASRIEHPNLCRVYDGGVSQGVPFMVMELIDGETLHDWIHADRAAASAELLGFVERIAEALHAVHQAGMLHRDVKPSNIMIGPAAKPVLLDFGLARDEHAGDQLTRSGVEVGTWSYMSPEQISPQGRALDRRTDVYSLGLVLYECVTGRRAFEGGSEHELKTRILKDMPAPVRRLRPSVSKELAVVIDKAIAKNRDDRYPTAAALAEDLRRIRGRQPITARRSGFWFRGWRWSQRNPVLAGLFAVLVLGSGVSTALFLEASAGERRLSQQQAVIQKARAASAYQQAELQMQRGKWHQALAALDRAERLGHDDAVQIAISRVVAWESSDQLDRAVAELQRLQLRADLGKHQAKILLLGADLDVNRLLNPEAKVEDIQRARQLGLGRADDLFAEAMLASTVDQAIESLRGCLRAEPSHRRAIDLLGNLSLVSGRTALGREVLARRYTLFPDDPTNPIYQAFLDGLDGKDIDVDGLLVGVADEDIDMVEAWAEFMRGTARLLRGFDRNAIAEMLDPDHSVLRSLLPYGVFAAGAVATLKKSRSTKTGLLFRISPCVSRAFHDLIGAMRAFSKNLDSVAYAAAMAHASDVLGEGFYLYSAGSAMFYAGEYDKAEPYLLGALERRSAIVGSLPILMYLVESQRRMARPERGGPIDAKWAGKAMASLGEILAMPELEARVLRHGFLVARNLGRHDHAVEIALRWRRVYPDDPEAAKALAAAEQYVKGKGK